MGRTSDARERLMEAVTELFWVGSYDGTTIDQICERAGVRKGSFYHFFSGKSELAEEALHKAWEDYRPQLDAIFSPLVPPLERLRAYCEHTVKEQMDLKEKHGLVLGCPLCTLGSEISTQDKGLRKRVHAILAHGEAYLETTIRDAHAAGLADAADARGKARLVHAYHMGLMTQARIQNDIRVLKEMLRGTFEILGVREREPAVA